MLNIIGPLKYNKILGLSNFGLVYRDDRPLINDKPLQKDKKEQWRVQADDLLFEYPWL